MGEMEKRWSEAQTKEDAFWQRNGVLGSQMERVNARYGPVIQGCQYGDNAVISPHVVTERNTRLQRLAVRMACHTHQPAHRLGNHIIADVVAAGASLSKA